MAKEKETELKKNDEWDGEERRESQRRRRRVYRFIDRRMGFDRRRCYPITGILREHSMTLLSLLLGLNFLSIMDGALTAFELSRGLIMEGNPMLSSLLLSNPYYAIVFKISTVAIVSLVIWEQRRNRMFLGFAVIASIIYYSVLIFHLWNIAPMLVR